MHKAIDRERAPVRAKSSALQDAFVKLEKATKALEHIRDWGDAQSSSEAQQTLEELDDD